MCNQYENRVSGAQIVEAFGQVDLPVTAPRDEVRPTDVAPIVRKADSALEVVELSWGLAPRGKGRAVINVRSEGRPFDVGRCLVPATAFFEFTGATYPKTKWRFTRTGEDWFCIAGIWRSDRFTMLTTAPGADVAPYHDRQIAVLARKDWARWLAAEPIEPDWLAPLPPGALTVAQVARS